MQALKRELKKLGYLTLFFFIGFGYILLLMKLFLKEYSINSYVLSKAFIGALGAAKAVAIMDSTPLLNRFVQSPRYISVLYKTFIYTIVVLIIGMIENIIHAYTKTKSLPSAILMFIDAENFYQFLAVILCISIIFLIYNVLDEIDNYLGKGSLIKLFFSRPSTRPVNRL